MRPNRGPTCLDEPSGGADGREIGRQGRLQRQLDEISAEKRIDVGPRTRPTSAAPLDASATLWAQAEAICERNGLPARPEITGSTARLASAETGTGNRHHHAATEPHPGKIRSCPRCGHDMQPAATLCGNCWLRVSPMGADGIEPPPLPVPKRPWWRLWNR